MTLPPPPCRYCPRPSRFRMPNSGAGYQACAEHLAELVEDVSVSHLAGGIGGPVYIGVVVVQDEAPTQRLPPIGETVRRRPPVPSPLSEVRVRELSGRELVEALAAELEREDLEELDHEDQGDEYATSSSPCDRRPGCFVLAGDRGACPCGSIL